MRRLLYYLKTPIGEIYIYEKENLKIFLDLAQRLLDYGKNELEKELSK